MVNTYRISISIYHVMRISFVLISIQLFLLGMIHAHDTRAQLINLKVDQASVKEVFKQIEKQANVSFSYNSSLVASVPLLTLEIKGKSLEDALAILSEKANLTFKKENKIIAVSSAKPTKPVKSIRPTTTDAERLPVDTLLNVSGIVNDSTGRPLPSVTVRIKGTNRQTATDQNGAYRLAGVKRGSTVIFSLVGHQPFETIVQSNSIQATLFPSISTLDETIVIGYGTTNRRLATGSVAKVTAKEIENQPVSNPLQALQGRAAGVLITNTNGVPGSNVTVQIRGRGSLTAGTEPLYIIDGVPFSNAPLNDRLNLGAAGQISPFNSIVPADIESIEILKDADATAIYGSRGANGVVLVTTKKGKAGKTSFDVNVNTGAGKATRIPQMLNTTEYLQFRKEAFANDGITPTIQNAYDLLLWDTTENRNWLREYTGGAAQTWDANASISGGNAQNQYLLRGNYRKDGTVYPGNWAYQRTGAFLSTQHQSTNGRFIANTSVNFTSDKNDQPWTDYSQTYILPPHFPLYNEDGSLHWYNGVDINNPESFALASADNRTRNLIANGSIQYFPIENLQLKVNGGYHDMRLDRHYTNPSQAQMPHRNQGSYAYFGNNGQRTYIIEPQANYNKSIKQHEIQALVGGTWQYTLREGLLVTGYDYATDALLGSLAAAGRTADYRNDFTENKFASLFARVNYRFRNTYILNASFRTDGSSRFAPDRRWGSFFAIGAAWLFSNEKLLQENFPLLSYGKLRGSYGSTGNDQIGDYEYLATYSSAGNYQSVSRLTPSRIANPLYSWEVTKKLEAALEIGFLKDRILLTAQWYRNRSDNQLINYTLPYYIGFTSYQANLPALIQNTGVEMEVQATLIQNNAFRWQIGSNFTHPRNKLLNFPGLENTTYRNSFVIGEPLDLIWGYKYLGVDSETGRGLFEDVNSDNTINTTGDRQVIIRSMTRNFGGFNTNFSYRNIELDIHIQYVNQPGRGINNAELGFGHQAWNISQSSFDERWQQSGDNAIHPRPAQNWASGTWAQAYTQQYRSSSALYQNATYVRLKNVNLSYKLPNSVNSSLRIQQCRLYFSGQNLLTFSQMKDVDPETQASSLSIPLSPLRMLNVGLQVTL